MRLESQHDTLSPYGAGFGDKSLDQRPVPPVHAVVRPDGHDRMDEARKRVETVEYPYAALLFPLRHCCSPRSL